MRNRLGTMNKFTIERVGPFFIALFLAMAALLAIPCTATHKTTPRRTSHAGRSSGPRGALNYIQGSVSLQPAGTQDWIDANPNRPLTTGEIFGRIRIRAASFTLAAPWFASPARPEFHF